MDPLHLAPDEHRGDRDAGHLWDNAARKGDLSPAYVAGVVHRLIELAEIAFGEREHWRAMARAKRPQRPGY